MSIFVVTGGAGFIGCHIASHLADSGHEVRVLDLLAASASRWRSASLIGKPGITIIEGDVRDTALCRRVCSGAQFVLHHAAEPSVVRSVEDPAACVAINVEGTVNMLQAAVDSRSVRRFVFASTCAVYGDGSDDVKRETSALAPITPYATTKVAGEHFCDNMRRLHGLQTVALRYFNVYGPGQDPNSAYAAVIPRFLTALANDEPFTVYGDGEQSRDFVYVDDIVAANVLAVTAPNLPPSGVFNIASGQRTSVNELIAKLERISGRRLPVERQPARAGDIRHSAGDINAARGKLGFRPRVSLDDGLARSLRYYRALVDEPNRVFALAC